MKKLTLLFICLVAIIDVFSQNIIYGKIIDSETKQPIPSASVYLNNTTFGMKTNDQGAFRLHNVNAYSELVVSAVGYEKIITKTTGGQSSYTILMKPKENILEEVNVSTNSKAWEKWGGLFSKLVLGYGAGEHGYGIISNPKDIHFYYNDVEKTLEVSMNKPLIIDIKALGYELNIDMDYFVYSFENEELKYSSTIQYKNSFDKSYVERIQYLTDWVYYGSKMHFYRSLFFNQSKEEGFYIYQYHSVRNHEKERVMKTVRKWASEKINLNSSKEDLFKLSENKDSSRYYKKVMMQKDVFTIDTIPVDIKNYVAYNSDSKKLNINFSETLMVVYRRNRNTATPNSNRFPHQRLKVNTLMFLTNKNGIDILEDGRSTTNELYMTGDMANRPLSKTLPFDYDPKAGRKLYDVVGF
ncbi:carboxypeptidase-like regulatory domain-containing protein [Pedobacter agri]|uniref:carboxypeptidase-like regulatory domain-containing protein n=1 Tax=Pedobacter agri TaxID=454586 RepID=UPI00292CC977|nr:carboxypeptidase-like regulatory domain-containing protein [Pedobacter agri]